MLIVTRFVAAIILIGLTVPGMNLISAQTYPNKPIRILTGGVGGSGDFAARLIAPELTANLRQPVIVDNRGGIIPIEVVAKAPPDGYNLLEFGNVLWVNPLLQSVTYNPVSDFSPITTVSTQPNILTVHPSLPVKSVRELIALAKARPGELNYASSGTGSSNHLAGELFNAMAGVNIVRVPYQSTGPAINDLLGGHVQLTFASATNVAASIKSGRLRALAVTSAKPYALFPELPTVAASGVPGYETVVVVGTLAPADTPAAIINVLNQEILRVLSRPEVKEKFFNVGAEAEGSSAAQFAARIKSEMATFGKIIRDAGIKAD